MEIYSTTESFLFFNVPYNAKRLLDDSVTRTLKGYREISEGSVLTGCSNILLGRVESVAAFSFVALSATFLTVCGIIITPYFLISATALNIISRVPGISSFELVQNFTRDSSNVIYRTLKVHFIAIPVIFLFLSSSIINILPGILKSQNIFFSSIHWLVEPLGPLQTIRAVVPGITEVVGTETELSPLAGIEEYIRALSCQSHLREVRTYQLTHFQRF